MFFGAQLFDLFFQLANFGNGFLFRLPAGFLGAGFFAQLGEFFFNMGAPFDGMRIFFFQQGLAFDFQLHDAPFDFVDFDRQRIDLHAQAGGRFVN